MNPTLLLSLILLGASLAVARQADSPAPSGASPVLDAIPLTNAPPQAQQVASPGESDGADAMPGATEVNEPPELGQTNASTQPDNEPRDSRSQGVNRRRDGRQSRQNRFARERQRSRFSRDNPGSGSDSGTNGPASLDYAAFKIIVELNIFDPNRVPSGPPPVKAPSTEYFGLVGTTRYEKGTFALFSGSNSKYERTLKVSDSIAGYKLTSISDDSVKLACVTTNLVVPAPKAAVSAEGAAPKTVPKAALEDSTAAGKTGAVPKAALEDSAAGKTGVVQFAAESVKLAGVTNEVEMRMGQQMRREEAGPWRLSTVSSSSTADSSFTPILGSESPGTNSAATTGGESEILKRMMQRRDLESK
jgi:hypothetical protein